MGDCCGKKKPRTVEPDQITPLVRSNKVVVFSKTTCPFSADAKALLNREGIPYNLIELDRCPGGYELAKKLENRTHYNAVPQIFVMGKFIGGMCDLERLVRNKELKKMIGGEQKYCVLLDKSCNYS